MPPNMHILRPTSPRGLPAILGGTLAWPTVRDGWLHLPVSTAIVLACVAAAVLLIGFVLRRRRSTPDRLTSNRLTSRHDASADPSSRSFVDVVEAERRSIAREIHDGPVQDLFALRLHLAHAAQSVDGSTDATSTGAHDAGAHDVDAGDVRSLAASVDRDLARIQSDLRAISEGLSPVSLRRRGLSGALRALTQSVARGHADVDCVTPPTDPPLAEDVRLTVFRVAQEALSNALRHACPNRVRVELVRTDAWLTLCVCDDGCGFHLDGALSSSATERPGLGLAGMRERARLIGARLTIDSAPGHGTCVTLRTPCPAPDAHAPSSSVPAKSSVAPIRSIPWGNGTPPGPPGDPVDAPSHA